MSKRGTRTEIETGIDSGRSSDSGISLSVRPSVRPSYWQTVCLGVELWAVLSLVLTNRMSHAVEEEDTEC